MHCGTLSTAITSAPPPHHLRTSNRGHGYREHQEQHNSLLELVHHTVSYIITGLWSRTQLRLILTLLTGFSFHLCVRLCKRPKRLPSEQRQAAVRHNGNAGKWMSFFMKPLRPEGRETIYIMNKSHWN